MAVLLETTYGDLIFELETEQCPIASKNFINLCKTKFYNNLLFDNIQKDFIAQCGAPPSGKTRNADGRLVPTDKMDGCAEWVKWRLAKKKFEEKKRKAKEEGGLRKSSESNFNEKEPHRWTQDEIRLPKLKHSKKGTIAMGSEEQNRNGSRFYVTLRDNIGYLDGKHTVRDDDI
jgi:peptidyl-prolyl cis-trans isomerase-like 4